MFPKCSLNSKFPQLEATSSIHSTYGTTHSRISGLLPPALANETTSFANTRIDWKHRPETHVFKADLPGLKKEKEEVEEGKVLQISGERSKEKDEKNDTWHRVERSSATFLRRIRLPENAKVDQVKAGMENGVLTVTMPKEKVKKPECKN